MIRRGSPFVEKLWGSETHFVNDPVSGYCGKRLVLDKPDVACSIHFHRNKVETFVGEEGVFVLQVWPQLRYRHQSVPLLTLLAELGDPVVHFMGHDSVFTMDRFTPHRFFLPRVSAAIGGARASFLEFSTYDDPTDSVRLVNAGPAPAVELPAKR